MPIRHLSSYQESLKQSRKLWSSFCESELCYTHMGKTMRVYQE